MRGLGGDRRELWIVLGITVTAAVLRFSTLGIQSVWLDEALAIRHLDHSFGGTISVVVRTETSPPFYFALGWLWAQVVGSGVVALRSLSAIAGILYVPALYLTGRWVSRRTGVWAAAFGAVSAETFYYSQEIRPYAVFLLLTALAFVAWQRSIDEPTRRNLFAWSALSILAVLTHYFGAFMFVGELWVLFRRHGWRTVMPSTVSYAVAVLAVSPVLIHQASSGSSFWISQESLVSRIAKTAKEFLIGPYGPDGKVALVVIALLVIGAMLGLTRLEAARRRRLDPIVVVAVIAVGLPALLAATGVEDVFDPRNLLATWTPFAILLGTGVSNRPRLGTACGLGIVAVWCALIAGILTEPAYQRDDWRGAARALPPAPPGGRIIVSGRYGGTPLSVYLADVRELNRSVSATTREVDYIFLRSAHSGAWKDGEDSLDRAIPPAAPLSPPPRPLRLTAVVRSQAFAVYRYTSPGPVSVAPGLLARAFGPGLVDINRQG